MGSRAFKAARSLVKRAVAVPFVRSALGGDYHGAARGTARVGIFLRSSHGKFLDRVRRKILQEAADVIVGVVAAIHRQCTFNPELPPKETAVMRALVGSEGSTGSVPGTR